MGAPSKSLRRCGPEKIQLPGESGHCWVRDGCISGRTPNGREGTMDLTIMLSARGDEDLVELAGTLDYACVPYLRQVVFGLLDERRSQITVEVSRLRIMDAASIKVLLYLRERASHLGGGVQL